MKLCYAERTSARSMLADQMKNRFHQSIHWMTNICRNVRKLTYAFFFQLVFNNFWCKFALKRKNICSTCTWRDLDKTHMAIILDGPLVL